MQGRTARLRNWLIHDSNERLAHWLNKHNQYSTWNAERRRRQLAEPVPSPAALWSSDPGARRRFLKAVYLRLPLKPVLMFLLLYVFRGGFLDGRAGLYFCALRAAHELNIDAKLFEQRLDAG